MKISIKMCAGVQTAARQHTRRPHLW